MSRISVVESETLTMLFGALVGGLAGWEMVHLTANGAVSKFLLNSRGAWAYAAAIGFCLLLAATVMPRVARGLAACVAAAALVAAFTRVQPQGQLVFLGPFLALALLGIGAYLRSIRHG